MSTLKELVAVGEKLQLTGKDLQAFIATQQEAQREKCRLNRKAERLEAERERQEAEQLVKGSARKQKQLEKGSAGKQKQLEKGSDIVMNRKPSKQLIAEKLSYLKSGQGWKYRVGKKSTRKKVMSLMKKVSDFFSASFTQVQTPVTLCSGELWSILVVRLTHSADLRSRLRHVSSAPSVAYSTGCSHVVTHPGTNPARRCLTSMIWREPVCHPRLAI